ncbi:MAG: hypothetical protein RBT15_04675 [Gudongella sp.]|jgi:hypothetical protein|nr:hypothetical protein [Gudongella sp.]
MAHDFWQEEKLYILTQNNQVFPYSYTPGADLQPLVNFFKKTERLQVAELYIQKQANQPMIRVTDEYNIK